MNEKKTTQFFAVLSFEKDGNCRFMGFITNENDMTEVLKAAGYTIVQVSILSDTPICVVVDEFNRPDSDAVEMLRVAATMSPEERMMKNLCHIPGHGLN